jgi:hypothetical protein
MWLCRLKQYSSLKKDTDACIKGFDATEGYEPTGTELCEELVAKVLGVKAAE